MNVHSNFLSRAPLLPATIQRASLKAKKKPPWCVRPLKRAGDASRTPLLHDNRERSDAAPSDGGWRDLAGKVGFCAVDKVRRT
jgi:hypothetical protein